MSLTKEIKPIIGLDDINGATTESTPFDFKDGQVIIDIVTVNGIRFDAASVVSGISGTLTPKRVTQERDTLVAASIIEHGAASEVTNQVKTLLDILVVVDSVKTNPQIELDARQLGILYGSDFVEKQYDKFDEASLEEVLHFCETDHNNGFRSIYEMLDEAVSLRDVNADIARITGLNSEEQLDLNGVYNALVALGVPDYIMAMIEAGDITVDVKHFKSLEGIEDVVSDTYQRYLSIDADAFIAKNIDKFTNIPSSVLEHIHEYPFNIEPSQFTNFDDEAQKLLAHTTSLQTLTGIAGSLSKDVLEYCLMQLETHALSDSLGELPDESVPSRVLERLLESGTEDANVLMYRAKFNQEAQDLLKTVRAQDPCRFENDN